MQQESNRSPGADAEDNDKTVYIFYVIYCSYISAIYQYPVS